VLACATALIFVGAAVVDPLSSGFVLRHRFVISGGDVRYAGQ